MNKNVLIYGSNILYVLIIGLSFLFVKIALSVSNPFDLLAYRFTFTFIAMLVFLRSTGRKLHYTFHKLKCILPVAILYPLLFSIFQTFGMEIASSLEAGILMASAPVFTLILASIFLKEQTTLLQKLSILLSVGGVIYITIMESSGFEFNNLKGILLLIASAVSISAYSVFGKKLLQDFTNIEMTFMMITTSFISFNVIAIGSHLIQGNMATLFLPLMEPRFLFSILYLAVLSSFGTTLLSNYVLSKIEASKMIVFSNLAMIISIIVGVVILNEEILFYHIIGAVIIIIGVIGTNFMDKVHF